MDKFRAKMNRITGPGGYKCTCCNNYKSKDKPLLNRMVRAQMKTDLNKEIESEVLFIGPSYASEDSYDPWACEKSPDGIHCQCWDDCYADCHYCGAGSDPESCSTCDAEDCDRKITSRKNKTK